MNLLASAVASLAATLQKVASVDGTYTSVTGNEFQMKGTVIERDYEVIDDDGVLTTVKSTDWVFLASDLMQVGGGEQPQPGDLWQVGTYLVGEELPDYDATYEAMLLGNRPCFQPHDDTGVLTVVHMKKVYGGG